MAGLNCSLLRQEKIGRSGEQSCTPSLLSMCHCKHLRTRDSRVHDFFSSVRRLAAQVKRAMGNLFATGMHSGDFRSQRMCPFCGLITARSKAFCLECGKSLREVHP